MYRIYQGQELIAARAAREMEWTEAAADRPSLAREFGRVQAELTRLRAILREHDIDPGDASSQP
jgi:hypothetical protein